MDRNGWMDDNDEMDFSRIPIFKDDALVTKIPSKIILKRPEKENSKGNSKEKEGNLKENSSLKIQKMIQIGGSALKIEYQKNVKNKPN
jgi:hypothetical protein